MKNENMTLKVLLIILVVVTLTATGYLGYSYMNSETVEEELPLVTEGVELTEEEVIEEADETVTDAIDDVVTDLESLETDEDFEDFDAELEFGVEL